MPAASYLVAALLKTIIARATVGGSSGDLTSVAVDVQGSTLVGSTLVGMVHLRDDRAHQMRASNQKKPPPRPEESCCNL